MGIFILVIGSLVALGLVNSRNLVISKHRLQAVNLAREAVEQTIQIRDTFWLNDSNWDNISKTPWGLSAGDKKVCGLAVDSTCTNASASHLYLESSGPVSLPVINGVQYTRTINIAAVDLAGGNDPNYLKVTATVTWQDFGITKTATVVTYLTNWKQ